MPITLNRTAASQATELASIKAVAISHVNEIIATRRLDFITDGPGQEMIYREKVAEAARYLEELPGDLTAYPFLAAEVGVSAPDAASLAALWLAKSAEWKLIGGQLEALRHGALIAIEAAANQAGIDAATAAFDAAYAAWSPPV